MGSFVFTWPNPAEEVYVTGTFDNWSQSVKLDKVGDVFQKSVELSDASTKIYYKFVVDGEWVTDGAAPKEKDEGGNDNNVLTPENIVPTPAAAAIITSAAPASTTAELAKSVPLEDKVADTIVTVPSVPAAPEETSAVPDAASPVFAAAISSAAPTSTTALLAQAVPLEPKREVTTSEETPEETPVEPTVEPTVEPSTSEEAPSTTSNVIAPVAAVAAGAAAIGAAAVATVKSTADSTAMSANTEDLPGAFPETPASELNKEVKLINPLPAAPGGVNPVQLAPGEPIPESLKSGDINANVKLDPESYEKADAAIAGGFSEDQLPPVSKNMIPESSLPIVGGSDFAISSVAPTSTTAALAGAVPLEKDKAVAAAPAVAPAEASGVPEVVTESQIEAGVGPEASAVPEEVKEKAEVEEELLSKVPEAPVTSDGTTATETATAAPTTATPATAPESKTSAAGILGGVTAAAAGLGAAAIVAATAAKDKAVEQATPVVEKATEAVSDASTKLPVSVKQALPIAVQEQIATTAATHDKPVTTDIPEEVKESFQESGTSPEAAANAVAVEEKTAVEAELLKKVKPAPSADEAASAAPAAAAPAAVNGTDVAPAAAVVPEPVVPAAAAPAAETPASVTAAQVAVANAAAPATPAKAAAPAPAAASPSTAEKKKKNRISGFFHKIIDKLDGDKKK